MNPAELASGLFRVLETGDPVLAAQVVAADNQNREAPVSPPACRLPGPAGTLASGAWMRTAFSGLHFHFLSIAEREGQVWARLRMQGRHTGPFVRFRDDGSLDQVIPPTGHAIDFEQVHVLDIRDGKVVRHEAVRDDIAMLGQLGVFPPSPSVVVRMLAWRISGRAARAGAHVSLLADRAADELGTRRPKDV